MGRKLKKHHEEAIRYADSKYPKAKLKPNDKIFAKLWVEAFSEKMQELSADPKEETPSPT